MGMVSSENPLSNTNKYYANQYHSKRQEPSLANQDFGDSSKAYYQKTGVVSKNNPMAQSNYYSGYHGKKMDEVEKVPEIQQPKYLQYHLQRITQKCTQRGERGLFGLKKLFQTYDFNGNGSLEYQEFQKALRDFKLDFEEQDIRTLFAKFDENGDGTIQISEFMNTILGQLNNQRQQAVDQAFKKLEISSSGFASYKALRDIFDGKKHPEVASGKKTPDECVSDFLEIIEIHHNSFNAYKKTDQVSKQEFIEFYKTLSPNYDADATFCQMVRGVWGVKNDVLSSTYATGFAGGNDPSQNSRDRYMRANYSKGTPFGTTLADSSSTWATSSNQNSRPSTVQAG